MKKLIISALIFFNCSISFALTAPESWREISGEYQYLGLTMDDVGHSYVANGSDTIIQLDQLGSEVNIIDVPGATMLTSLVYFDGFLYTGDIRGSDRVYRIDLTDFSMASFSNLSGFPDGIGANSELVFVVDSDSSGQINGINPSTMEVIVELNSSVPDIVGITNQGNDLIVLSEFGDIYRVNSGTGLTQYLFSAPVKVTQNAMGGPESILLIGDTLVLGYSTEKTIYIGNVEDSSIASYSLAVGKVSLPALNVKGFGLFDVNLSQEGDSTIFQVDDNVTVARNPGAISATFDLDTGIIEVPQIEFQDANGTNIFRVELTLIPNTEPLQFELTQATRLN